MKKKITNLLKYLVILLFILTISLLLIAIIPDKDGLNSMEKTKPISITGFYNIDGGPWQELTSDTSFDTDKYHTITIRGNFNQEIPEKLELLLYIRNLDISLKVDKHTIYEFGNSRKNYPFRSSGITWGRIASNVIPQNAEIELTMSNAYLHAVPGFRMLLDNIKIGHYSQLYTEYISESGPVLLIAAFSILLAFLALLLALIARIFHFPQTSKSAALSFFAMATGLWILLNINYLYVPLIIPIPSLAMLCDILSVYLMPETVILLIVTYTNRKIKYIINILVIIQYIIFSFLFLLQLFGVTQLLETQQFGLIFTMVLTLTIISLTIYDAWKNKNREEQITLLTLLPCVIGLCLEAFNYFFPFMLKYIFSAFSCLLTLILQIIQIIYMIKRSSQMAAHAQQLENELLQSKISMMFRQIKPHFLYNTLTAISHLCDVDGLKAQQAIIEFSTYLRGNLDSLSERSLEPFQMELNHIKVYLSLEKMRFEDDLNITYDIQVSDFLIPPLTVQPVVENAVRYGVGEREDGGTVNISTRELDTAFEVIVKDDGIGFEYNRKEDGRSHIGIQNVKNRLAAQCNGTLTIESVVGIGTTVTISIPKDHQITPTAQY